MLLLESMVRERCVLPARCRKCEAVFDMWPDLSRQLDERNGELAIEVEKSLSQSLCWKCRHMIIAIGAKKSEGEVDYTNSLLEGWND